MPRLAPSALVPAAARAPELLTDVETELNIKAVETFTAQLGGREQLTAALAVAEGDIGVEKVLTYLLDPRYDRWSLPRICRLAGLTIADFFIAYKRAVLAKAHIEATHIIAANLPPIVEDVMRRAAPQRQVCPACAGAADKALACPTCRGAGSVQTEPDLDRQKLALELGQLTEKRGGLIVQQNQVAATVHNHAPGALEQFQQVVGDLLFSPRKKAPPIETEEEDLPPIGDPDTAEDDMPFEQPDSPLSDPGLPDAVRDAPIFDPPREREP
jgi:hypothetical protein